MAVADLNRDGLVDIAVADFLLDTVEVRLAQAVGGFAVASSVPVGRGPRSLVAADFNADGIVDLAVGEFFDGSVRILTGHGDGRFDTAQVWRAGGAG